MLRAGSEPGQGVEPGTCESQVKVNCEDTGLGLDCWWSRLRFSCPSGWGIFSAFAIAVEMIPVFWSFTRRNISFLILSKQADGNKDTNGFVCGANAGGGSPHQA